MLTALAPFDDASQNYTVRLPGPVGLGGFMSLRNVISRALVMVLLSGLAPRPAGAQANGSASAAVAGGVLGLFSGTILGVAGSIIPCTQTYDGAACIRWHAFGAGALGLVGGALMGRADADRVGSAAGSAGIGFLAGSAAGLVLKPIAQRVGWLDVLTVGLLGGAIGASPEGAAIGFGAGAVAGLILWRVTPGGTFPDALSAALAGLALGGVGGWLIRGAESRDPARAPPPGVLVPLASIRF
jgi:hypothetical protein